jgi:hypothetical protein
VSKHDAGCADARSVDTMLAENAEPLKTANLRTFTDGLAKNTGGLDSIVADLNQPQFQIGPIGVRVQQGPKLPPL